MALAGHLIDLKSEPLDVVAARILNDDDSDDDINGALPYVQALLVVFLQQLARQKRRVSIKDVYDVVNDPPVRMYRELTDVLRNVPRRLNATVLSMLRDRVRRALVARPMPYSAASRKPETRRRDANVAN